MAVEDRFPIPTLQVRDACKTESLVFSPADPYGASFIISLHSHTRTLTHGVRVGVKRLASRHITSKNFGWDTGPERCGMLPPTG